MDRAQQERVNELVADALELPGGERRAFVVAGAGDDAAVRDEALRLVEQGIDAQFLEPLKAPREGGLFGAGDVAAGRYRIEKMLGRGGMGEVYAAWDERLGQRVALKTIRPDLGGDSAVMERFRREVAVARTVTHPNVCRVFDLGEHGDVAFLTMEYLEGETLGARITRTGGMGTAEAMPIVRQIAAGLEAAHRAGVVHRDFKPGNVMLSPDGEGGERAVVTDFGLARQYKKDSGETLTEVGVRVGSPEYMAPEQWSGSQAGPAADVYALGVVLHEMVTGLKPAEGSSRGLEKRWAETIARCLARDPGERARSAAEVVARLEGRHRTRRRWWIGAGMAAAILLALFAAGSRFSLRERDLPGRSVALLPFRASDPELQAFADGLMEAITQRLSQFEAADGPLVVAPASEMRRGVASAREARGKVGATHAVEATLQAQEGRLRLVLAVVETASLRQVETAVVEGTAARALSLQDDAVKRLATALDLRVQPEFAREMNRVSPAAPGAYEYLLQAKGYLQRSDRVGDVESAIALLERVVREEPENAEAHAAMGEAYWYRYERQSDPKWVAEAQKACRRALELDGRLAAAHVTMGKLLAGTGRRAEAIAEFDRAIGIDARDAEAYRGLGRVYTEDREYAKAEATYRKAIDLRPGDWRGYRDLGLFHYRRSDYARAIEQFEQVVRLTPDNASAYNNLGAFYGMAGDRARAQKMLEQAVRIEPARVSTLNNLVKIYLEQGRPGEAITRLTKALEFDPTSYRLWANLAGVEAKAGRGAESRAHYEEALRRVDRAAAVNPGDRGLKSFRGHLLSALGRKDEAVSEVRAAGGPGVPDLEQLVRDAITLVECGLRDEARPYLDRALELGYPREEAVKQEPLRALLGG